MGFPSRPASEVHSGPTRRRLVLSAAALGISGFPWAAPKVRNGGPGAEVYQEIMPEKGVDTGLIFGDAIPRLIAAGALDPDRLRALGDGLPPWVERLFAAPSETPIVFTRERAPYLVNLLWPIGLSNRAAFNRQSPINSIRLPSYASTGGWTLGRAANGYVYFDAVEAVAMTPRQAALALDVASNSFRPCCDNSTFFQDCNHGSALLGLIELAASQGAAAERIYGIALTANAYWFPREYAKTALYCRYFEGLPWTAVPARLILGATYSSLDGWRRNVEAPLRRAKIRLPADPQAPRLACGI